MQMILTRLPKVEDMTRTVTRSAASITTIVRWALIRVNKLMQVCFDCVMCYELMSEKRQLSLLNFSNKRPCREDKRKLHPVPVTVQVWLLRRTVKWAVAPAASLQQLTVTLVIAGTATIVRHYPILYLPNILCYNSDSHSTIAENADITVTPAAVCSAPCCTDASHQPYCPNNFNRSKRLQGKQMRSCQKAWLVEFPWLTYCATFGTVFCFHCREVKYKELLTFSKCLDNAFITTGFNNWKKAKKSTKKAIVIRKLL